MGRDHLANMATVPVSDNPQETGNLLAMLYVKVMKRVMLINNIDFRDNITNCALGTVAGVIIGDS